MVDENRGSPAGEGADEVERFEKAFAFTEEPVIVSAAGHPPIEIKGSFPKTILAFENGCPHRRRLEDWYAKRGEMPERTIELGSYHAMLGCIVAGMGAALLQLHGQAGTLTALFLCGYAGVDGAAH